MRKLIIIIATLALIISSCQEPKLKTFTGYIVGKEYSPERMSNQSDNTVSECVVVTPKFTPPPPHRIEESWGLYIANKQEVVFVCVPKETYNAHVCGEKITIYK